jgi:putative transcriptional regulator
MIRLDLEPILEKRGRSFYWLAKEAEINQSLMSRMRHGKVKGVTFKTLDSICTVLECEPGDIIKRVSESKRGTKKR